MNKLLFPLMIMLLLSSCKKKKEITITDNLTKIEIKEREFDFGNAYLGDTVIHVFKIKNITNTYLKIKKTATSCGCTTLGIIDSLAEKGETIEFKLQYIPKDDNKGKVSNSLVVEMNTEPSFAVFRLKGNVVN